MIKPSRSLGLAVVVSVFVLTVSSAVSQTSSTTTVATPVVDGQGATLTFANSATMQLKSHERRFPLVGLNAGESVNVKVQFPATLAGQPLVIQSLDGAAISLGSQSPTVGSDGSFAVNLMAGTRPGRYRVLVAAGGISTELQFWVPTPNTSDNPQFLTH